MEWINTEEKLPQVGQQIEITCKHWEVNWVGQFEYPYIDKGSFDEFGNFWDCEGCRVTNPSYWRPYQPERSKREDKCFVIKGSNECIALDATPSEECKEYHRNSCIQVNHDGKSHLMRCSEQSGN